MGTPAIHEVKIGSNTFYIRRFDPFTGLEVFGDLQKVFLGPLMAMGTQGDGQADADGQQGFMAGIEKLSANIDGKKLRQLANMLLDKEHVSVALEGQPAAKLDDTMKLRALESAADVIDLCMASVRHNFADFMTRWAGLISQAPLAQRGAGQPAGSARN